MNVTVSLTIRCALFDFDETLVNIDDFVDWRGAREAVIRSYIENGVPREVLTKFEGIMKMLSEIYEYLLAHLSRQEAYGIQHTVSKVLARFEVEAAKKGVLLAGVKETLVWLRKKRIKVGIFSSNSSESIRLALRRSSINPFVNMIVGRAPPLRMKPHPDQLRYCLRRLRCTPREAVAVGDKTYDIIAAKELGIFTVAVTTGESSKEDLLSCGPDRIIGSLYELPAIVEVLL